jgi:dienelactone hydrolase
MAAGAAALPVMLRIAKAQTDPSRPMAEKMVPYQVNGRRFEGMIVYDDSVKANRPAVFMQPDWKGVCGDTIAQARTVAGKDYVVLMADMYGSGYGDKPKTTQELMASMRAVHDDLAFTLACGGMAYDTLLAEANKLGLVDATKQAAIGYCAGGGFALEQARISRRWSCSTSPIPIRSLRARLAASRAGCWRSMVRPIR